MIRIVLLDIWISYVFDTVLFNGLRLQKSTWVPNKTAIKLLRWDNSKIFVTLLIAKVSCITFKLTSSVSYMSWLYCLFRRSILKYIWTNCDLSLHILRNLETLLLNETYRLWRHNTYALVWHYPRFTKLSRLISIKHG